MLRRFRVSILTLAGETEIINDEAITIKGELRGEGEKSAASGSGNGDRTLDLRGPVPVSGAAGGGHSLPLENRQGPLVQLKHGEVNRGRVDGADAPAAAAVPAAVLVLGVFQELEHVPAVLVPGEPLALGVLGK